MPAQTTTFQFRMVHHHQHMRRLVLMQEKTVEIINDIGSIVSYHCKSKD